MPLYVWVSTFMIWRRVGEGQGRFMHKTHVGKLGFGRKKSTKKPDFPATSWLENVPSSC